MKTVTYDEKTHAIVPIEPTDEMLDDVFVIPYDYKKMIKAAPPYQSVTSTDMVWIPCSERYPIDRASVLVYCSGSGCVGIAHYMSKFNCWSTPEPQSVSVDCVTYWMNLPASPKGEE